MLKWGRLGWCMRKPRSTLAFFMVLALGLWVTLPAEDVPETAYDESELLPYESTSAIASLMPQASPAQAEATDPPGRTLPRSLLILRAATSQMHSSSVEARDALPLLCTFLC